ncbi:hypothetical protein Sjap_014752 [Stephania japonica]|uniref:Uncharacterized protein n=1 Tax=Stephania japonica TaxID=461633 RepID=A0AAP0IIB9_9MAGN
MGTTSAFWAYTRKSLTAGLITFTVSDRFACISPVRVSPCIPHSTPTPRVLY